MGSEFNEIPDSLNGFKFDNGSIFPNSNEYPKSEISTGVGSNEQSLEFSSLGIPSLPSLGLDNSSTYASFLRMDKEGDSSSPSDDSDFPDTVLKYISQVLLEEDMDDKPCMFHDSLALQAAEKSLYDVLGETYPPRGRASLCSEYTVESPDDDNTSFRASGDHSTYTGSSSCTSYSIDNSSNYFSEGEFALQFKRGVEEASKFLPKANQLTMYSPPRLTGKKNHDREDEDLEEARNNKQSAVFVDESEVSDMFDKVFICGGGNEIKTLQPKEQTKESGNRKTRGKKHGNKKEVVDLRTLLILCAQAVSSDDGVTTKELIKQIRQHSSPSGDGSQRLATCFVDAIEARLSGTGTQIYTSLGARRSSAADMLKAYQIYFSACPFMKMSICFANNNIFKVVEKATTLHVIDFGIFYGFSWPALIHRLANRPGGPPRLRITGIEFPQRGFRPADAVHETGHRLARYCERYNVPFEFNAIAQKWETIQIEDLKINSNEVIAVNSLFRFKNLLDETVMLNSPRDIVLNLIRKINPDIFVHNVVNGSYNAPFFVTRFREALYHYSALFDMCETNISHEDNMRSMLEQKFYGREIMNVVACEGTERVERPEAYKQWQVRMARFGFTQLPLDPEFMKKVREKVKDCYHNDFIVDVDGRWMLHGWKGRIVYASSAWVPASSKT